MTAYDFTVTDEVQIVRDAIIAILDTNPAITALTGRGSLNLVPFQTGAERKSKSVAFIVMTAHPVGGCGKVLRLAIQFSAIADSEALANQMLHVVENSLTPMAFLSLDPPINAYQSTPPLRRGSDEDGRTDTEIVLDATFPLTS